MNTFTRLADLDPMAALHGAWDRSSPAAAITTGSLGFTGYLASVNWSASLAFVCFAVPLIFGALLQLVRQWKYMEIDVETYRSKAAYARGLADATATERTVAVDLVNRREDAAVTALAVTVEADRLRTEGEGAGHP
jgi:hypothetical protein